MLGHAELEKYSSCSKSCKQRVSRLEPIFTVPINYSPGWRSSVAVPLKVATRTWDELNAEAQKSLQPSTVAEAPTGKFDRAGVLSGGDEGEGFAWLELWGVERSSLPQWFQTWQANDGAVRNKIRNVVREEWVYMREREAAIAEGEQAGRSMPRESRLPPPGPPLLDKSERIFDVGAYVTESTVFPFVLFESFWKYSDPKLAAEGDGTEKGRLAGGRGRGDR